MVNLIREKNFSNLFSIVFLLVITSSLAYSQGFEIIKGDTVNRTDVSNLKQGKWIITNKTKNLPGFTSPDQVVEEVTYKDGKKEGVRKLYFPNGKFKSEVTFVENRPKGLSKTYYETGTLSETGNWIAGGWEGLYQYYYDNGNLCYEWLFNNGKREGEQKYYYSNGKLNYIGNWKDGNESGILKEYNDAGLLVAEKNFSEGKLNETASVFYTTPKIEKVVEKQEDVGLFTESGYYSIKNKNGKLSKEGTFSKGQLIDGKQFQYSSEGKLMRTLVIKEGKVQQTIEE